MRFLPKIFGNPATDFDALKALAIPALETIYQSAQKQLTDETVYAVVLSTYSSNEGLGLHVNTEENYVRLLKHAKVYDMPPEEDQYFERDAYRWYWAEWGGTEYIGNQDALNPVYDWMIQEGDQTKNFGKFTKNVHTAMIDILSALDKNGVFGRGQSREQILLYTGVYDGDTKMTLRAAKALNSPDLWVRHKDSLRRAFED